MQPIWSQGQGSSTNDKQSMRQETSPASHTVPHATKQAKSAPATGAGWFTPKQFPAIMPWFPAQIQAAPLPQPIPYQPSAPSPLMPQEAKATMPVATSSARPRVDLIKLLKDARLLGCERYGGSSDAEVTDCWLQTVTDAVTDMCLSDEDKVRVATRLLEGDARIWWNSTKARCSAPVTWQNFVKEFNAHYYTSFHKDQKRQEFFRLEQGGRSIVDYATRLEALSRFVPELANCKEFMCTKFVEGLHLDIREMVGITNTQNYNEMVQIALKIEELIVERTEEFQKGKRKLEAYEAQTQKRSRSSRTPTSRPSVRQFSRSFLAANAECRQSGVPWCRNCRKPHSGQCREPLQCFYCHQQGHFKRDCPELRWVNEDSPELRWVNETTSSSSES